jgi:serine protease
MGASQRRLLAAAASLAIAASGFGSVVPAAAAAPTTAVTDEQVAKPTSSPIGTSTVPVETPAAPAPTEAGTPLPTEEPSAPAATTAEKGGTPELVTSGSYTTSGAIGVKYATASAVLGAAISPEFTSQRFGGAYQLFENGTIAYLPQYGAYIVIGGNNSVWQSIGAQDSDLGYPISAEYVPMTGGVMQIFQFGKISWNPATGSRVTKGGIGGAWDNAGGPLGGLGYPTTDEYAPMPNGVMQDFQYGKISWNAATGSRVTKGGIGGTYDSAGGPLSGLGYPTTDEYATVNGGATQDFQYGQISYSPATGSHVVRGAIGATWILVAGPQGHFGYPTADEINGLTGGGAKQYFQYGEIVWSPGVGTKLISGGIRSAWAAQGSEAGRLGYPTNNEYWVSGGSGQDFQGGRITWHSGSAKIEYASGVHQPAPAPAPVY